ncbi:MAG: hypothetical protein WCE45_08990, partial [Sedimentisphaerales bacterium]
PTLTHASATQSLIGFVVKAAAGVSPPGAASSPNPAHLATSVSIDANLSWTAGSGATSHDVYFGTNPTPGAGEFIGNQPGTTYDPPGSLSYNTTYYWRIDEKNASGTTTGTVWSFTTASPDTTPPTPNPMTWASVPTATGPTTITMTATTATDSTLPVMYYFECTTDGSKSSTWQTGTTYVVSGLAPSTLYSFRVKARDSAPALNETGWSTPQSATTLPPVVVYDYTGITNPSSSHKAEDGEIDVTDAEIIAGTFGARRDTIAGWALWAEATTAEYAALVSSDDSRYSTADPGNGDNAAMIFEFYVNENPVDVEQIDISVEIGRGASTDLGYAYLWNYSTSSYLVLGTQSGTADGVVSASITSNPGDYINPTTGQVTVFVVNMDDSDVIQVDRILVTVYAQTPAPPGPATYPSPAAGATNVGVATDLSWTAGSGATSHIVYFGTSSPGTLQGEQGGTTFDTGTMSNNTTYYWRIDEKNAGGTTTGIVWNFTTISRQSLTTSATSGGTVTTPGIGTYWYDYNSPASIVAAVVDPNRHFVNWTGTAVTAGKVANANAASTTVTMDSNYTVTANFAYNQVSLITTATAGGTVTTPGIGTYWY